MPDREKQDTQEERDILGRVIEHSARLGERVEKEVERRVREIVARKTAIKVPATNLWIELHCEKDALMRKYLFLARVKMSGRDGREEAYTADVQLNLAEHDLPSSPASQWDPESPQERLAGAVAKRLTEGMEEALKQEIRCFIYSETARSDALRRLSL